MKINNKDVKSLNAIVNSFTYRTGELDRDIYNKGMSHLSLSQSVTPQARELIVTFESERDTSRFTSLLSQGIVTIEPGNGFIYECLLSYTPSVTHIGCDYYKISYPLSTIQKGHLVRTELKRKSNFLRILGTWEAPCRISITPDHDINVFTINSITVKNLKRGITFVIDGINKLVEANGVNRFGDTDIKKFPSFPVGDHEVRISEVANVVVEYYPIYM